LEDLLKYDDSDIHPILDAIDIIFIAVPHDLHESIAFMALQGTSRQLIVLEKPLAPTRASCDALLEASIIYQHRLFIAEQSPYWPAVQKAQSLIHTDKAIGEIISIASYYYESMRDNVTSGSIDAHTGSLGWRGSLQRAGGGIAIDGGLHWIRPIRELYRTRIQKVMGVICPIPQIQRALAMEGETLGHALFELEPPTIGGSGHDDADASSSSSSSSIQYPPFIATYSCCMLASPAPMAHDTCPYLRITGTAGELVIAGTGLQKHVPNAGGLRLYNTEYPSGKDVLEDGTMQPCHFFMAFIGLWDEIHRVIREHDTAATHESVVRAADDVRVVLAFYKSSTTKCWEWT
jgi:predicted dehydrogenase